MELMKFLAKRFITTIGSVFKFGLMIVIPILIALPLKGQDSGLICLIVILGYSLEFYLWITIPHILAAKSYMKEHSVTADVAWRETKPRDYSEFDI